MFDRESSVLVVSEAMAIVVVRNAEAVVVSEDVVAVVGLGKLF